MLIAMAVAAVLCVGIGSFPALLYAILPFQTNFHPYSLDHVVGQVQLLFLSALAFTLLMRTGNLSAGIALHQSGFRLVLSAVGLRTGAGRRTEGGGGVGLRRSGNVARCTIRSALGRALCRAG